MAPKPEKTRVRTRYLILTLVCVTISLMTCAVKKPCGSGDKNVVGFNMAADSSSAWKDEEVKALIDIFSEETIQFSLEKARCLKDKNAVYNDVKVKLESQGM